MTCVFDLLEINLPKLVKLKLGFFFSPAAYNGHNITRSAFVNDFENSFFFYKTCNLLIFACPEGMEITEKSFENHIKVDDEINIDQRYQNISKLLPKTSPKPYKMVGVELRKSTSSLKKTLRVLPRRFQSAT